MTIESVLLCFALMTGREGSVPVSEFVSLLDRQLAADLLLLELAGVGAFQHVCVGGRGNETDDVEAEDHAVCGKVKTTVSLDDDWQERRPGTGRQYLRPR